MNKEPIGLYIFRFLMGLGLFFFMCMLYWSSLLIEEDMKAVQSTLTEIKQELAVLKTRAPEVSSNLSTPALAAQNPVKRSSKWMDDAIPNLLQEDPFYAVTLPKMLGPNFKPHGTLKGATIGKPDNLQPFSAWATVATWTNQCNVSVANQKFGIYESYAPEMAIKIELRTDKATGLPEYWVHLRDDVYWEPLRQDYFSEPLNLAPQFFQRHQVTAHDFKFYYDAIMNPYNQQAMAVASRTYYDDVEEIKVLDDFTFIVRWKTHEVKDADGKVTRKMKYSSKQLTGGLRPLASFVYKYFTDGKKIVEDDSDPNTYRKNSVWAQNFNMHWAKNIIVSCGPWIFDGMTDREIRFKRNPNYFQPLAVLVEASVVSFKQSTEGMWQDFQSNNLDTYSVQPDQLIELERFMQSDLYKQQKEQGFAIKRLDYVSRSYSFLGWNEAKEFFKSEKVRQALTLAIDRKRIIRQNLHGMGIEINGTFSKYSPAYDTSIEPWPYDPDRAKVLLAEEGWYDSQGTGVIDKVINGQHVPFSFTLTYYVKSSLGKTIAEYVSTALKDIGIEARLKGVDIADLSAEFDDKSFDGLFLQWMLGTPPEDPKQLWSSVGAKEKGSSNAIGFSNKEADEIMAQLDYEYDPKKRIELYHRFDQILYDEAPYVFLFTPKVALVYREYLQNVFIPAERQDLVPGANVPEPDSSIFWIKQ